MYTSLHSFLAERRHTHIFIFIKIVWDFKFVNAEILYGVRLKIPQSRTLSKKLEFLSQILHLNANFKQKKLEIPAVLKVDLFFI